MEILSQKHWNIGMDVYRACEVSLTVDGYETNVDEDGLIELLNAQERPDSYGQFTAYHSLTSVVEDQEPFFAVIHGFYWASALWIMNPDDIEQSILEEIEAHLPVKSDIEKWTITERTDSGIRVNIAPSDGSVELDFAREDGDESLNTLLANLYPGHEFHAVQV